MRLIDADEMLYELSHWKDSNGWYHDNSTDVYHISEIRMVCDKMPTVDAGERKRGHWSYTDRTNVYGGREIVCSVCGESFMISPLTQEHLHECERFCCRCGADMRGEANDVQKTD